LVIGTAIAIALSSGIARNGVIALATFHSFDESC